MKMKRKGLFLLILAALVFSACQSLFVEDRAGQVIRFSASAGNGMETRTNYSGYKDDVTNKERIDWLTGDKVKVYLYLDNAPGYYWDHTSSDYKVTLIDKVDKEKPYISKGTLSSEETSLKWVGTADDHVAHWFYSIYPADYSGDLYKDTDGSMKVDFKGLANQNGTMDYAYMAAVAGEPYYTDGKENPNSNKDMVNLDYYPMITTVYVTVENASGKDLNLSIRLSSKEDTTPLAGPYTVVLNGNGSFTPIVNTESGTFVDQLNQSLPLGTSGEAAKKSVKFFLLPVNYTTSNLNLTLSDGNKTYSFDLNKTTITTLQACHKYNVNIKLNNPSSEPEPPTIEDISDGGAQMLSVLIKKLAENGTLKQYLKECYPNSGKNFDDDNTFWNPFNNSMINGGLSNVTATSFFNKLKELLGDDWIKLLEMIVDKVEEIDLPDVGGGIPSDIEAKDFKIFRNVTVIKTPVKGSVDIEGLPNLITVELNYATKVSITGCDELTSVKLPNSGSLKEFTLKECKNVTKFDMTDPWETWTSDAVFTFDNLDNLSSVILCSAKEVNVYDCPLLPDANISMKNPVSINRDRKD